MKLKPPFPLTTISQGFGKNFNHFYAAQGLKGHTGIDFVVPYDTPIPSAVDAYCYSILNKGNPNLARYRGVFTIVDESDFSYEVSYGHCNKMFAEVGNVYETGKALATIGNSGDVFSFGKEVSTAEKQAGSKKGAHLHFQVRKLKRVPMTNAGKQYILDSKGLFSRNGMLYEVVDYNNGYHGCIDPAQLFGDDLSASDKIAILAAESQASGDTEKGRMSTILWKLVGFLKSFGL